MCVAAGGQVSKGRKFHFFLVFALLLVLTGCSGTTTFKSYTKKMDPLLQGIKNGQPFDETCLTKECQSKDKALYSMERGRLAMISGSTESSIADFKAAMAAIEQADQKAVVSASNVGAQAAAVMVNDNAIPYKATGYERVFLHHYQAMNYLAKKDLEGAAVEVRRANFEQEEAFKRHEKDIEKAQEKAEEKKVNLAGNSGVNSAYAGMDEVAGKVKNSFQNAYTFYFSGVLYEMTDQPNDAYIDYKKALEIFPENKYLQKDALRLAKQLEMEQDYAELKSRFNIEESEENAADPGQKAGELVILFEEEFVPQKQEVKIPIPLASRKGVSGFTAVAFPVYKSKWTAPTALTLSGEEGVIGKTEPISYVDALAVKALKEQIPSIIVRQTLRATAKAVAAKVAKDRLGFLGSVAASAYNLVSENADLRSWVSLPANAQILRTTLPAGVHKLTVSLPKGVAAPLADDVEIAVNEGGVTFLHVVQTQQKVYSQVMPF